MIKLYKKHTDGSIAYHEAWIDGKTIIEHWGTAGTRGESRDHSMKSRSKSGEIDRILQSARQEGFSEIDISAHRRLLVEYPVQDMGTSDDLEKRHKLEERLNNLLGWTGLGMCDGGSIGSGSMEVCCFVVDFSLAKSVIAADLMKTEFADFSRIYDEALEALPNKH